MEPDRVDLSPLDPENDQLAYERRIRRVMEAAAPELERRARAARPLALVAAWARPTIAAAAVIIAVAAGALFATERQPDSFAEADSMVEALGVPAPAAEWLEAGREPTASDLVLAMERNR